MVMGFSLGKGGGGGHHHHGGGRRRGGGWYGYGPGYWEAEPSYIVIAPQSCGAGTYPASDGTCRVVPAGMVWNGVQLVSRSSLGLRGVGGLGAIGVTGTGGGLIAIGLMVAGGAAGALLWRRHRVIGGGLGALGGLAAMAVATRLGVFNVVMSAPPPPAA